MQIVKFFKTFVGFWFLVFFFAVNAPVILDQWVNRNWNVGFGAAF